MYEIFLFMVWLTGSVVLLGICVVILQISLERFITRTLPILAELYGRIRYPKEFL